MGVVPLTDDSLTEAVRAALASVMDPEIRRPITELGMVRSVQVTDGRAVVGLDLTTSGCPLKDTLTRDVTAAASGVDGVTEVAVELGVMSA